MKKDKGTNNNLQNIHKKLQYSLVYKKTSSKYIQYSSGIVK